MGRSNLGPRGSLPLVLLTLGSCSLFGLGGPDAKFTLTTSIAPDQATLLVAEACRSEHPGADPIPLHPGALVLHHQGDDYEVRYNRAAGQGYRLYTNGRLVPSDTPTLSEGARSLPLAPVTFQPAGLTGHLAPGADEVWIRVHAISAGSRLTVRLYGEPATGTLRLHLERLFALADSIQTTALMVEQQRWGMVRLTAEEALADFGSGCCKRHEALRARLLVHLAAAEQAQGHLVAARTATAMALGLAPFTPGLRLWQVRLSQRLAQTREMATDWHVLAASPSQQTYSLAAAAELHSTLGQLLQLSPGPGFRQRASSMLRENDFAGARSQLDLARIQDPQPRTDLRNLTLWHQRQGHHRAAFETCLQRLEIEQDPGLILEIAEHCSRIDQSTLALRLLANHWDSLIAHDQAAAEAWLQFHVRATGPELATRVLTAEGASALAKEQFAQWVLSGRADPVAVDLLPMVWWLRTEALTTARDWEQERLPPWDYESAPGVGPLR